MLGGPGYQVPFKTGFPLKGSVFCARHAFMLQRQLWSRQVTLHCLFFRVTQVIPHKTQILSRTRSLRKSLLDLGEFAWDLAQSLYPATNPMESLFHQQGKKLLDAVGELAGELSSAADLLALYLLCPSPPPSSCLLWLRALWGRSSA